MKQATKEFNIYRELILFFVTILGLSVFLSNISKVVASACSNPPSYPASNSDLSRCGWNLPPGQFTWNQTGVSCSQDSQCYPYITPAWGNVGPTSAGCFGYSDGSKCLVLEYQGPPPSSPTPTPGGNGVPPACDPSQLNMSIAPNPGSLGNQMVFHDSGSQGSTYYNDSWSGGVDCTPGIWWNSDKSCNTTSAGSFTWTHTWKNCAPNDCSKTSNQCSESVNYSINPAQAPSYPTGSVSGPTTATVGQNLTYSANLSVPSGLGGLKGSNMWIAVDQGSSGSRVDGTMVSGFNPANFNCGDPTKCYFYKIGSTGSQTPYTGTVNITLAGNYIIVIDAAPVNGPYLCSSNPYVTYPLGNFYSCGSSAAVRVVVSGNSQLPSPTSPGGSGSPPIGGVNYGSCAGGFAGWTCDSSENALNVEIYQDGTKGGGGTQVMTGVANVYRSDTLPCPGVSHQNHGYLIASAPVIFDGSKHSYYIYGVSTDGTQSTLLPGVPNISYNPEQLTCNPLPFTPTPGTMLPVGGQVLDSSTGNGISGVKITVFDSTQNKPSYATTDNSGNWAVNTFVLNGDIYSVSSPNTPPTNYISPGIPTNLTNLCHTKDSNYTEQGSSGICGANSHPNCAAACNFAYNPVILSPTPTPGTPLTVSGQVLDSFNQSGISGVKITVFDSTQNKPSYATTDNSGNWTVSNFVVTGDTYSVSLPAKSPTNYLSPGILTNTGSICNKKDTNYLNQNSSGSQNGCSYNSHPNCAANGGCNFAYTPVLTTSYRLAESQANLDVTGSYIQSSYTSDPSQITYTLSPANQTSGLKTIWVRFYYNDGTHSQDYSQQINYSPNPVITSVGCVYDLSGSGTDININGYNFGPQPQPGGTGGVSANNETATITAWGIPVTIQPTPTGVQSTPTSTQPTPTGSQPTPPVSGSLQGITSKIPDQPTGSIPVQVTISDGRQTSIIQCPMNTTSMSFSAKIDCRLPAQFSSNNVVLQVYQVAPGVTKPFYPANPQSTFSLDQNGVPQAFTPPLQAGINYALYIKAPYTLGRVIPFTAQTGLTVLPDIALAVGDIFPLSAPDGTINSLDISELYREYALSGTQGLAGDFNQDGAVNSLDYACMRNNVGKSSDIYNPPSQ